MRQIEVEELSWESFALFGTYFNPRDCGPALDNEGSPLKFFPDRIMLLFEDSNLAALSPLVVEPRKLQIDVTECHAHTEEAFGGFNRDVIFHVGPAGGAQPDPARFKVFRLPAGWWARIKRGVWHHGPFALGAEAAVGTVILPPATYTHDCHVVNLSDPPAIEA